MKLSKFPLFFNFLFLLSFFSSVIGMHNACNKKLSADLETWFNETDFVQIADVWYPITDNTKISDLKEMYFQAYGMEQDFYAIKIDDAFDSGYIDAIILLEDNLLAKEAIQIYRTSSFFPKNYLKLDS